MFSDQRLLFLGIILFLCGVSGNKYIYPRRSVLPTERLPTKVGLFTSDDAPNSDGTNAVVTIQMEQTGGSNEGGYYIALLHSDEKDRVFGIRNEKGMISFCSNTSELIFTKPTECEDFERNNCMYKHAAYEQEIKMTLEITKSGLYYFYMMDCNPRSNTEVVGSITFRNPYGYLPGQYYGFLPFYLILSILYFVAAVFWAILLARHWGELLMIHIFITCVIGVGMIESLTWYFYYWGVNSNGEVNVGTVIWGILIGTVKRSSSYLLVLCVSMGYGVVIPTLQSEVKKRITGLALLYTFSLAVFSILEERNILFGQLWSSLLADLVWLWVCFLLLHLVWGLGMLFCFWIAKYILRTISTLKANQQEPKLQMYQHLLKILIVSAIGAVGFTIYNFFSNGFEDELWVMAWIVSPPSWPSWDLLFFIVLAALVFWWRPTSNKSRYAALDQKEIEISEGDEVALDEISGRSSKQPNQKDTEKEASDVLEAPGA